MRSGRFVGLLTGALIWSAQSAVFNPIGAQEVELPEVVIYDFPDSSVAGREATSSITIIDRDEIEQSGASDVYELISGRVPGVFVDQHGIFNYGIGTGAAGTLSIRGLGGTPDDQVLVLLDGQPTTMGIFGHPIPDAYPLEDVERIEVLRGAHSLHYGDQALGGVVNIITRRLRSEDGFSTTVSAGGGEYHSYKASLSNSGKVGDFSYTGYLLRRETEGHRPNSAFRGWNGNLKAGYYLSDHWQAVLNGWGVDFTVEDPGPVSSPHLTDTRDVLRAGAGLTVYNTFDDTRGAVTVFGQRGKHDFTGYDGWKSHDRTLGITGYQSITLAENNQVEVGGDIRQAGGKGENVDTDVDYGRYFETRGGLYVDDQQTFWESLTLQAGLRLELAEHADAELLPRFGARYLVLKDTVLHGQVSRGYRAPTIRDLYIFPPSSLDLEPEEAWSSELGIRRSFGDLFAVDLTGYYIDADNLIVFTPPRAANTGGLVNRGIELATVLTPCTWYEMLVSYTYLDQNHRVDGLAPGVLQWINRFIWRGFSLQSTTSLVEDLRFSDRDEDYCVTDLKLSCDLNTFAVLTFKVNNVLDEDYQMAEGYPMPGRWLWGEASVTF
ncbi:MAG: TonB-dependent receptor [PVC group bacterium]